MEERIELNGLSESKFYIKDKALIKRSKHFKKELRESFNRQAVAYTLRLDPLIVVRPIEYVEGDYDSFHMDFIYANDLRNSCINDKHIDKFVTYFSNHRGNKKFGFKDLVKKAIENFNESDYKKNIMESLDECDDIYLDGYSHGDFGTGNLIIKNDDIYIFDFVVPVINTILFDVAVFRSTLKLELSKERIKLIEKLDHLFKDYLPQIEILKKLRAAQFYKDSSSDRHKAELDEWFSL